QIFDKKNNLIKELIRTNILKHIWNNAPIDRAKVSKELGLSRTTLTIIAKELIENKILEETGHGESTKGGGKKPILLNFREDIGYIIGITVGIKKIKVVLGNIKAQFLNELDADRDTDEDPYVTLKKISDLIKKFDIYKTGKILGIGIGIPGIIDHINGIVKFSPNLKGWENVTVKKYIEDEFPGVKCYIDRETNLQIFAEKWFGQINSKNFITIEAGVGIGIGIIINDRIYRGNNDAAGEFGHTTIIPQGSECHCGNYGCWETVATIRSFISKAYNGIEKGIQTKLPDYFIDGNLTFESIINAYKAGDGFSKELLEEYAYWLGVGISNIVNVFDPELIIIYGSASQLGDLGIKIIKNTIASNALPRVKRNIEVKYSLFGKEARIIGTFGLVIKNILSIPDEYII
ncbi:MAG: ROK family protein, partial [Actinobacteria bacterium]|nr:ROK family protein [Actinomycetota bacterium]